MSFNIMGSAYAVPKKIVTNDDLSEFIETTDEWIVTRTGISTRHVVTDETALSLTTQAANEAIERSGIDPLEIDLVICATLRGDTFTPSLACCVSEACGIKAPAFDINAACTGIMYAFNIAKMYFDSGCAKKVLVLGCEILSKLSDWTDRSTCMLFGDGAAACVLEKGDGLLSSCIVADPNTELIVGRSYDGKSPFCTNAKDDYFIHMQGGEVYKFAVKTMVAQIKAALEIANLDITDIDYFLPHQANQRIVDAACKKLGITPEKTLKNIDKFGNMSATSVLSLMAEGESEGKFKKGDNLLMVAFGAGMTAGASIIKWSK